MFNDINLEHLKIFYYVASSGSITKASEQLFISQPAITQTIQKLENKLGLTLFLRNKKGVVLTSEGHDIFKQVKLAYSHLTSIEQIVKDIDTLNSGELRIGCGSNMSIKLLLKPLIEFNKNYPNITCTQIDKPQSIMFDELLDGKLDLCISQYNPNVCDKFNFLPLLDEEFVFVCTKKYFFNLKTTTPLFIVQGDGTYNKALFNKYITEKNIIDYKQFVSVGYNFSIELCLNDYGISLVPKYLIDKHLKNNNLIIFDYYDSEKITYGIYTNKHLKNKKVQTLQEFVLKYNV